jgi:hypothetical protein
LAPVEQVLGGKQILGLKLENKMDLVELGSIGALKMLFLI